MLDFHNLPLISKIILVTGFLIAIASFLLLFRYTLILVLMKYNPEYRQFIKKMLEQQKLKK